MLDKNGNSYEELHILKAIWAINHYCDFDITNKFNAENGNPQNFYFTFTFWPLVKMGRDECLDLKESARIK